jgi:plastocyanin
MNPKLLRRLDVIRKSFVLLAVVLTIPLTLAACGDDDDDETAAGDTTTTEEPTTEDTTTEAAAGGGGGETVDISETEFAIDPKDVTAAAGEVTFAIANDGSAPHNLEVEGNGIEELSDTIEGGQKTNLTVNLEPGEYEMYCAIPGHREQGMEGTVTVE